MANTPELSKKALDVPAEMVLQIACGMEDPLAIAGRFGFTDEEFGALSQWEPFRARIAEEQARLKQSGQHFRMSMAWMAEDLSKDLYVIAKGNDIPYSQKLETFRTYAKLADLEPRPQQQTVQGTGFNIVIQFPETSKPPVPAVYDAKAEPVVVELPSVPEAAKA